MIMLEIFDPKNAKDGQIYATAETEAEALEKIARLELEYPGIMFDYAPEGEGY